MPSFNIAKPLLAWYDVHARSLPWRDIPTPYRVWVSEIMLQQTRVDPAIPYFERFVSTLPNIAALAQADEETVLKLWEGLGYYSRVRNLQRAAQVVMETYDGELPRDPALLLKLPGIGEYTAGAIASIAYQVPAPAVDGNVLRVLSRLYADERDIALPETKRAMQQTILELIAKDRPGDFNQALMDLGATICIPNGAPHCEQCPLSHLCLARKQGLCEQIPKKTKKQAPTQMDMTVFIIRHQGRIALQKRPQTGLLAGLWEFPNQEGSLTQKQVKTALEEQGFTVTKTTSLPKAKHVFTHKVWKMRGVLVTVSEADDRYVWATASELSETYTLPTAFRVYLQEAIASLS